MELLPGFSCEETGWWVDQWLAALRDDGLSAGRLEHLARVLGRMAGMDATAAKVDENPVVAALRQWVRGRVTSTQENGVGADAHLA